MTGLVLVFSGILRKKCTVLRYFLFCRWWEIGGILTVKTRYFGTSYLKTPYHSKLFLGIFAKDLTVFDGIWEPPPPFQHVCLHINSLICSFSLQMQTSWYFNNVHILFDCTFCEQWCVDVYRGCYLSLVLWKRWIFWSTVSHFTGPAEAVRKWCGKNGRNS